MFAGIGHDNESGNDSMKTIFLTIAIVLLGTACQADRSGGTETAGASVAGAQDDSLDLSGPNANFLVKLTSSMSAEDNEPGDPVTGVVIAPVPLRGGRVEGTIDRADRSFLEFGFHTLNVDGESHSIESAVTSVVNSKGNMGRDDLDQRIRMVGSSVIAYGTTTAIDEGAEIRFVAWQD